MADDQIGFKITILMIIKCSIYRLRVKKICPDVIYKSGRWYPFDSTQCDTCPTSSSVGSDLNDAIISASIKYPFLQGGFGQ